MFEKEEMVLMKKILSLICIVFVFFSFTAVVVASQGKDEILFFPVNYKFGFSEIKNEEMDKEYTSLYYKGHIYSPVRFIAENSDIPIDYDPESKTVLIGGPIFGKLKVSADQAKIVAYEKYKLKHVNEEFNVRILNDDEKKKAPEGIKNPVFYFITGLDESNNSVTVCVSSIDKNINFINK